MSELNFALLEHLPEGVICTQQDIITAVNLRARALLPGLEVGQHILETPIPAAGAAGAGTFYEEENEYRFSVSGDGDRKLYLFSPLPPQSPVPVRTVLTQLRQCTSALMMEEAARQQDPEGLSPGAVTKALYSLFRVIDNADFLDRRAQLSQQIPVDLVSLYRRLTIQAGELLKELNVELVFSCTLPALILPGDPELLERLFLELIANSAKVCREDRTITVQLTCPGGRKALLTVRDGGSPADGARLLAAMGGQEWEGLPLPGQGAGLGLAVARHIVRLHRGVLMAGGSPEDHCVALALPLDPARSDVSVRTPFVQTDGGLSPLLLGLCDLLPSQVFDPVSIT